MPYRHARARSGAAGLRGALTIGAYAPISRSQQQVAAALRSGLRDGHDVIAVTGEAGLGKTTMVSMVLTELGMTAWAVSALRDDPTAIVPLILKAKSPRDLVLVVDDAHALPLSVLITLLDVPTLDTARLPRLVFVGRPNFFFLFRTPSVSGLADRIRTSLELLPMSDAEAERYVRMTLGIGLSKLKSTMLQAVVHGGNGNPRRLREATEALRPRFDPRTSIIAPPSATETSTLWSGRIALLMLGLAMAALMVSLFSIPERSTPEPAVAGTVIKS